MTPSDISVVIPAINEESTIGLAIRSAWLAGAGEVIVVDGGSDDSTILEAKKWGATKVVKSFPGRGVQLNAGAALVKATQQVVLFLHSDNQLNSECLKQICELDDPIWGAFRQQIDSPRWLYRWLEKGNDLRVLLRRMPFGDQAIFVSKEAFNRCGGFEEITLMEDVSFSAKMRKVARPELLRGPIQVSSRRWRRHGVIAQTLKNWCIQVAFALGVKAETLRDWYR